MGRKGGGGGGRRQKQNNETGCLHVHVELAVWHARRGLFIDERGRTPRRHRPPPPLAPPPRRELNIKDAVPPRPADSRPNKHTHKLPGTLVLCVFWSARKGQRTYLRRSLDQVARAGDTPRPSDTHTRENNGRHRRADRRRGAADARAGRPLAVLG